MGYHLNLIRDRPRIFTIDEINILASRSKDLNVSEGTSGEMIIRKNENEDLYAFFRNGEIWANDCNGDEHLIFLIELAKSLKARVRGDELETYKSPTEWYTHPNDKGIEDFAQDDQIVNIKKREIILWAIRGILIISLIFILWDTLGSA